MFWTIVFFAVFAGSLFTSVALWALFLRLGLRWAKVPGVTTRRIVLTTAIVVILQAVLKFLLFFLAPFWDVQSTVVLLVEVAAEVILPFAVICTVFKARFVRELQAWLPTILATVMTVAFVLLVLRPFLYEAFSLPTNAMAPTLVGRHWKGVCPECGRPNYCSPRDERYGRVNPPLMICDYFHVKEVPDIDTTIYSGECFMVAKFLTPRRWDLIVFQCPDDPATWYVSRLVGLPGETIHIQDGSVWVDGRRVTPPDSLQGVEYLSELPGWPGPDLWGSVSRPALLGHDEYFVLGDFSAQSRDSRLWEQGAPGHNPFAVPESYVKGVVIFTYWPPRRWRIHR